MRRFLILVLVAFFSIDASAQSSVTLYGIISDGLTYVSNAGGSGFVKMDSGINQQSRFGFKGSEDLGAGWRTVFELESAFDVNSGDLAFNSFFGRRAYVGLANQQYGTLTMGRDFDFIYDELVEYTNAAEFAPSYSFHLAYDVDRLAGESVNNTIKYKSPSLGGVTLGVMYGFSNVAGSFGGASDNPRVYSVGLSFNPHGNAPYEFAAAFTKTDGAGGTLAQIALNAKSIETAGLGGRLSFGPTTASFVYTYTDAALATGRALTTSAYEAGVQYRFSPFLNAGVGYAYIDQVAGKWHIVSAGTDYHLSKRTDIYLFGTWQHAFAGAGNAGNFLVVTPTTTEGYSSSANQLAVQIGIRHLF